MSLETLIQQYLPAVEAELKKNVERAHKPGLNELRHMLAYHLGWEGKGAGPAAAGKRIRPMLVLLTTAACGGAWERALPAAAAVELVHNFSLIHDDIEDNSPLRRGRETVWKLWGIPQAVNAGDTMFTLAHLALLDLAETVSPHVALEAAGVLQRGCLHLTQGQYLDLSYETRADLTQEDYWPMIEGKTGALLAACTGLGALAAEAPHEIREACCDFGRLLGLAFQVEDDLLGIWGDAALTGKSAEGDLVSGKKSLPVLYGLNRGGDFARRWSEGAIFPAEAPGLAQQLENEGARTYAREQADRLTRQALQALDRARPAGEAGEALRALALKLLGRKA